MPANPRVVAPAEQQSWTGETEPNARTHHVYNRAPTYGSLRQPKPAGFFLHICLNDNHGAGNAVAGAAAHWPITSRQPVSRPIKRPIYSGSQVHSCGADGGLRKYK